MKSITEMLKPRFWSTDDEVLGTNRWFQNYRRVWAIAVALLSAVALIPLLFVSSMDYRATRNAIMSENLLRTTRTTSNTRRTVSYFLEERRAALALITRTVPEAELRNPNHLREILGGLKAAFGGYTDLGLVDENGRQVTYVGPYALQGKDYSDQPWFRETMDLGSYVSSVFLGYRDLPHFVLAVRFTLDDKPAILRATIDISRFQELLTDLTLSGDGDAFIVNTEGILQTPSRLHGDVLEIMNLPVPERASRTQSDVVRSSEGEPLITGYAYVEGTPFIVMIVKRQAMLMESVNKASERILWITGLSGVVILLVILGVATFMVGRIYDADQTRIKAMRDMEHANRMASIGRLAAGVAHEINNPLAIINEKAGLLRDLFTFRDEYKGDDRLVGMVDSIINSVERCGTITKRLLGFARQVDTYMAPLNLPGVVREVLSFVQKEAEYRSIDVQVILEDEIPSVVSDRGKVQQIFLNLVTNAFHAMEDGGSLDITIRRTNDDMVELMFSDDGCGIAPENMERIFEPFFSTRKQTSGTGLGLSITYGLVNELGGEMDVASELGTGTTFIIRLPIGSEAN
ncbi:sensor histidine kinase [Salidesulfovibrio brasiliensis]|uniref:sensor histidine kinase n=1 Tax=Salidesulfovibrio brasiliensis TaxID=221711 RepID=UPI0009F98231|nr:PAS domain-containing sensor histidine kinase [Salidesulfovibrio brasiliensis]